MTENNFSIIYNEVKNTKPSNSNIKVKGRVPLIQMTIQCVTF